MKKLLIMGANPETVSLIQKAREMGYYTIVTDYNPDAFAKRYADEAADVDAADVEGIIKLALEKQVNGILVGVAEALLPAYCDVCEGLGLPAYSSKDKFEIMTRKDFFKQKCREYGVPTIREYDPGDLEAVAYPVIVKPVDSCSSKGIRVCHDRVELDAAIELALSFSRSGKYLIEEYMTGDEVISYYVMQDGNPIFVGMCDRYTYRERADFVQLPNAYIFPSRHIGAYQEHCDAAVKAMIRGIGLDNGSIFFQCFVDAEGIVRMYEPGYRLNGAQEHILVSRVSGIDAKEIYINLALTGKAADFDLEPFSNPVPPQIACKLSPLVRTGRIKEIRGLDDIAKLPGVVSVNPSYRNGDTVAGEGTLKQIVCRIFIVSVCRQDLMDTVLKIYDLLRVTDDNGEDMLIGKFDTDILKMRY